jgi:hypothetical protein
MALIPKHFSTPQRIVFKGGTYHQMKSQSHNTSVDIYHWAVYDVIAFSTRIHPAVSTGRGRLTMMKKKHT